MGSWIELPVSIHGSGNGTDDSKGSYKIIVTLAQIGKDAALDHQDNMVGAEI